MAQNDIFLEASGGLFCFAFICIFVYQISTFFFFFLFFFIFHFSFFLLSFVVILFVFEDTETNKNSLTMSESAQQDKGGKCSACASLPWQKILRVIGAGCGVGVTASGLVVLFSLEFNVQEFVNALYQILFGLLMVAAELRFKSVLTRFNFLTSYAGLAFMYLFVGGLALGKK
jgi:COPI associated protein